MFFAGKPQVNAVDFTPSFLGQAPNPKDKRRIAILKKSQKPPPNRSRPIRITFCVTEEEIILIEKKMQKLNTGNISAYMRKMAIDGYIIEVDYSDLKSVCYEMHKIGTNINQIAKRANSTNVVYASDFAEIKKRVEQIWQLLKSSLLKFG